MFDYRNFGLIHRHVFYLKQDLFGDCILSSSEVEPTQVEPIDRVDICLFLLGPPETL
jgi:hypothetical protein